MPHYGRSSEHRLRTVDPRLQRVFRVVIGFYDNTILEGHRGEKAQNAAVAAGNSQLPWPEGNHNDYPSLAVDAAPYYPETPHIRWGGRIVNQDGSLNRENLYIRLRYYHFAGIVQGVAEHLGTPVRWGGDWDSDRDLDDQTFNDLVHFELVNP